MIGGTYSSTADMGLPAGEEHSFAPTAQQALAERAALSGVPPLIAAELAEHLDFYRALPADMPEADKDRAFYERFPEAEPGGFLLGGDDGEPDAIEGLA